MFSLQNPSYFPVQLIKVTSLSSITALRPLIPGWTLNRAKKELCNNCVLHFLTCVNWFQMVPQMISFLFSHFSGNRPALEGKAKMWSNVHRQFCLGKITVIIAPGREEEKSFAFPRKVHFFDKTRMHFSGFGSWQTWCARLPPPF